MESKNLPIKFFQKRQKDELDTEAGGSKKIPNWVDINQLRPVSYTHLTLPTICSV